MTARDLSAEIIGFDSGWGCRDYGCEDGPRAVDAAAILNILNERGVKAKWRGPLGLKSLGDHKDIATREEALPLVVEGLRRLSVHARTAVENGHIPVVIGGDHSSAIGTWSGAAAGLRACGSFGLVWIDAHLDAHTFETSSEGKWGGWWHGQPVAALTGNGLQSLTRIGGMEPKISPRHISIIGTHSFEPGEAAYVKKHGIRIYHLDEVRARGFKAVFEEALARARDGTAGFGLTMDLDAFNEHEAPGVGAPEGDGLTAAEVLPIIRSLARTPDFTALEIAELNPHNDKDRRTAKLVERIIAAVFDH